MGCDSQFDNSRPHWESSVEEPTRPVGLVKDKGPKIDTTRFLFPDRPCVPTQPAVFNDEPQVKDATKADDVFNGHRPPLTAFEQDLRRLINKHCMENLSNTPDRILAEFLASCLVSFSVATRAREEWYGRKVF